MSVTVYAIQIGDHVDREDNMKKTKIPYDIKEFDDIRENGAIVDVSLSKFENIDDDKQFKTFLIYLRNTNFSNIVLDFSSANYNTKSGILKEYMFGDIESNDKVLEYTAINILLRYKEIYVSDIITIFSDDEEKRFIDENIEQISRLYNFVSSTPIYLYSKHKGILLDLSQFESTDDCGFGINYPNIIKNELFPILVEANTSPKNYIKEFNESNKILFESLTKSVMAFIVSDELMEFFNKTNDSIINTDV